MADVVGCYLMAEAPIAFSIAGAECSLQSDVSTDAGSEVAWCDEEQAFTTERVLAFIDWDDTLFPTTWLSDQGLLRDEKAILTEEQQSQLAVLADRVAETLEAAEEQGRVVIVTSAGEGWVQQSCLHFMPSLAPHLRRFPIISARATFEPVGVRCPTEWKRRAFEREVEAFSEMLPAGGALSLVSIGDSVHEHRALLSVAQATPGSSAKSLKLAERPSIEQLIDEHLLVAGTLEDVALYDGDLDVDVAASV